MNYFDILLAKKLEDDRDPKVEGLSVTENGRYHEDGVVYDPVIVNVPETPLSKLTVTENGTYTAPSGTAYSEVDVDVPLPENAYLLKEIEDVEIASFNDGSDLPMPKLEVAIKPQQEGSGDPSPENIRPIIGWDEAVVTVADDVETPTVSNVYTIDLDGTRYGGTLDVVSGVLTVDRGYALYKGEASENIIVYSAQTNRFRLGLTNYKSPASSVVDNNLKSNIFKTYSKNELVNQSVGICAYDEGGSACIVKVEGITTVEDLKTWLSTHNLQICYPLTTPTTIQLSPTVVKSLRGRNNVWADTGNILDLSYLAKEE